MPPTAPGVSPTSSINPTTTVIMDDTDRRPSLVRDRPSRPPLPLGPRVRARSKRSLDLSVGSGPASIDDNYSDTNSLTSPITFTSPFNTTRPTSPSTCHTYPPDEIKSLTSVSSALTLPAHTDVGIQVTPSPPPTPTVSTSKVTPTPSSVPLVPLPAVSLESIPIPWKGLPLEVAQWTFSSAELQEIVSRAIRLSAKESFVRLLSVTALDTDIVVESDRLDALRLTTQAKYRFQVQRRMMLLQALNSTVGASLNDPSVLLGLIAQVNEVTATCDTLLAELVSITDQQAQISRVQHRHWSSALGIALRKLSKSYERQGAELKKAQEKMETLNDELEEAWREAETMANEFDNLEYSDDEEGEEEDREGDDIDADEITLGDISTDLGEVVGVTATAVLAKPTLIINHPTKPRLQNDAKSMKSARSKRSTKSQGASRQSKVLAAKTRSRAASNASLRLPKSLRGGSSAPSPIDGPPVPALPTQGGQSFLDMDSVDTECVRPIQKRIPKNPLPEPPHTAGLPRTT
ncbi:hypothetical protein BJ138DRAFT_153009 [Hygrophoropsis aurantiaca]|uniref:Uncharacterized protein n=1 Tax=Hygrophoropsis aurantiaca TaxID=72124 RepID=A0ACB8A9C8_9AGAM|nr:hypothetical protein BJ138DRAFT_153009 [Hygrophoropsis aurantiaca]